VHDIAEFLWRHEPFDELTEDAVEEIAGRTEVEYFRAQSVIFEQGAAPQGHVRIIRRGAVELLDGTQVLDELSEGEMFGHPSMLTGQPTMLAARASEDTLCYRIEASDIQPLLVRPAAMRYFAREVQHRATLSANNQPVVASRPIASLVSRRCVVSTPETSIREVAKAMVDVDVSCAVIRLPNGHGIVTDHDLRERVIAADHPADAPVSDVMSSPAMFTDPERSASDVAMMMLERGVRHVPVIDAAGAVLGVARDIDLLAAETQTPFTIRREIAGATSSEQVREIAAGLPKVLIALDDAGTAPIQISRVHSAIADAIIGRLLELIPAEHGRPGMAPLWIALGSHGRRELSPGSDLDSAVTWPGHVDAQDEALLREFAQEAVNSTTNVVGLAPDPHGETAASPLFARSLESWRHAVRRWAATPETDKVPVVLSALLDGRAVGTGPAWSETVFAEMINPSARQELERWLLRLAVGHRLPTGFLHSRVLDPSGVRRNIDLKRNGLQPIVDLARYAGFVANSGLVSTPGRLAAGAEHGVLRAADTRLLVEAHELFTDLRIEHQIESLRNGTPVTDTLDPSQLNALARNYVKDAFRLVAGIQRRMIDQLRTP
jgi:CBS domain-containing protein